MKVIYKALAGITVALACGASAFAQSVYTGNSAQLQRTAKPTKIDEAKRDAAFKVAGMLSDRYFSGLLQRELTGKDKPAMLAPLLKEYSAFSVQAKTAADSLLAIDMTVRQQKAIAGDSGAIMEVSLYTPKNYAGRVDWKNLLVAYPPGGRKSERSTVEAFDQQGHAYRLDGRTPPRTPVLVVGINRSEAHRAGVALVNRQLQAAGMQTQKAQAALGTLASNIETSKLDRIRLKDDQEPWISGAAEVYAVVSGVQPDQAKATLTVVDMPYLDYDGTDYTPNQILVFWSDYRYAAANVQLFEHDDNTNYKDLAVALSQGVTAILGAFAPTYAVIGQVATAILQAMPANWFSNDDDYLDSFYTLEKGRYYSNYVGAAGNATMSLSPYTLQAQ
jgi:hypothetical protein